MFEVGEYELLSPRKSSCETFCFFHQVEGAQSCYLKFLLIEGDEREDAEVTGHVASDVPPMEDWILHQTSQFVSAVRVEELIVSLMLCICLLLRAAMSDIKSQPRKQAAVV